MIPASPTSAREAHVFAASKAIVRGEYSPGTRLLRLWFTSAPTRAHDYPNVPAAVWRGLCEARSAGNYYNRNIRHEYEAS